MAYVARERARIILTTYLRIGIEAAGHTWRARNDRHVEELIRCLQEMIEDQEEEGGFAAELDAPSAHPARASTFIGRREDDGGLKHYKEWRGRQEAS